VTKDFALVFKILKPVMASQARRLAVKTDSPKAYELVTKSASPYPQHKGQPLWFGVVKVGKAYVSYHLVPLYMHPGLKKTISPALKKHMQGKACFNFKAAPDRGVLAELKRLTAAAAKHWSTEKLL
jgi:hypothetical protein